MKELKFECNQCTLKYRFTRTKMCLGIALNVHASKTFTLISFFIARCPFVHPFIYYPRLRMNCMKYLFYSFSYVDNFLIYPKMENQIFMYFI